MQIQSQSEWYKPRAQGAQPGIGFSAAPAGGYAAMAGNTAPRMAGESGEEVKQDQPAQKPAKDSQKATPQDSFNEERRQGHGNASTWMSLYKFCGPLIAGIGYGAIFGSPIGFAAGVSLIVSSLQAGTALKIHKEDTPWAKNIVRHTRKLMGRENDRSAAGKEWSMVPVWGAVCGLAGLTEASINHAFAHKFPKQELKDVEEKSQKGFFKHVFKMQAKTMKWANDVKTILKDLKSRLPDFAKKWVTFLENRFTKNVKGNALLGYLAGIGVAGIGGMVQSASAAKIQERLDAKHAQKAKNNPDEKKPEKASELKAGVEASSKTKNKNQDEQAKTSNKADATERKSEQQSNVAVNANATEAKIEAKKMEPQRRSDSGKPAASPEKTRVLPWGQPAAVAQNVPPDFSRNNALPPAQWNPVNPAPMRTQVSSPFQNWLPAPMMPPVPPIVTVQS